jgi:mono/diheme cytochrome c family protein
MKLKNIYIISLGVLGISMSSCVSSGDNPGIEYAPQMYVSQGYEPYSQTQEFENNPNGMTMRLPVNGTVARGQLAYQYPNANTAEGYEAAATYTSNIPATQANVDEGKRLYEYACWHCHGKTGGNDGPIFKSGKMPGPAWANVQADYIKNIPMGKMYHTITYGKGLMGSHAHILSPEQRWQVIYYLKSLSLGDEFKIAADDAEAMEVVEATEAEESEAEEAASEESTGNEH